MFKQIYDIVEFSSQVFFSIKHMFTCSTIIAAHVMKRKQSKNDEFENFVKCQSYCWKTNNRNYGLK